jgi:hypothetical protein
LRSAGLLDGLRQSPAPPGCETCEKSGLKVLYLKIRPFTTKTAALQGLLIMMIESWLGFEHSRFRDNNCGGEPGFAILTSMQIKSIPLEDIELEDQRFRISEDLDSRPLENSLREIGQLNPVNLVSAPGAGWIVVCGFRRVRALGRLRVFHVTARLWRAEECPPLRALLMAFWDNHSHRPLHPLEIATLLTKLKHAAGMTDDILIESYLPVFSLPPQPRVLRDYFDLYHLQAGLRRLVMDGALTPRNAIVLARAGEKLQHKMAGLLAKVHLSSGRQREVIELVGDLAVMRDQEPDQVLEDPFILKTANDEALTPARRGEIIHRFLRRERNPRFVRAKEGFESERGKLDLPASVRISPDPYFETSRLHVEFDARSTGDYRTIVAALEKASVSASLANLFRING